VTSCPLLYHMTREIEVVEYNLLNTSVRLECDALPFHDLVGCHGATIYISLFICRGSNGLELFMHSMLGRKLPEIACSTLRGLSWYLFMAST